MAIKLNKKRVIFTLDALTLKQLEELKLLFKTKQSVKVIKECIAFTHQHYIDKDSY